MNLPIQFFIASIVTAALLSPASAQTRRRTNGAAAGKPSLSAQATTETETTPTTATIPIDKSTQPIDSRSTSPRAMAMPPPDEEGLIKQHLRDAKLDPKADVRVGYGLGAPVAYYDFDGTTLSWKEPVLQDTHYLFITLQDAASEQVLPGCKVTAVITDGSGKDVSTSVTLHETWDPKFRHYGSNVSVPETATTGTITIKAQPPVYRRRDQLLGAFFSAPLTATFANANLSTESLPRMEIGNVQDQKIIWPEGRRPYSINGETKSTGTVSTNLK